MRLSSGTFATLCALPSGLGATPLDELLRASCTDEPALSGAARAALDDASAEALRALAVASGLPAPAVQVGVFPWTAPGASVEPVRAWLGPRLAPGARCAIARQGDRLAVALVPRLATVSPLVTAALPGSSLSASVALHTDVQRPTVYVLDPSGAVLSWPLPEDRTLRVPLPLEGTYAIEITGDTGDGARAWARWQVVAGAPTPARPEAPVGTADALVLAINDLRRRAGLGALRRDPLLGSVALGRARALAEALALSHGAEGSGPVEALASRAVYARRVAENLARAPSLAEAHARLCASPSHRAVLLDPNLDALGVGVARTATGIYLVELFAQAPALRGAP